MVQCHHAMNTSAEKTSVNHVRIPCSQMKLRGELAIPDAPRALVILLHEATDGWTDCGNWPIAWKLYHQGFGTLLVNPLAGDAQALQHARKFGRLELPVLVERVTAIIKWAKGVPKTESTPVGLYASGLTAAAAIQAASSGAAIDSLVCRAARTDLIEDAALRLEAPILLLAEEADHRSRRRHFEFANMLHCERKLATLKRIPHCPKGDAAALQSARFAANWFSDHLECSLDRIGELVAR
jgi:putative phosphoribosyl transferase